MLKRPIPPLKTNRLLRKRYSKDQTPLSILMCCVFIECLFALPFIRSEVKNVFFDLHDVLVVVVVVCLSVDELHVEFMLCVFGEDEPPSTWASTFASYHILQRALPRRNGQCLPFPSLKLTLHSHSLFCALFITFPSFLRYYCYYY